MPTRKDGSRSVPVDGASAASWLDSAPLVELGWDRRWEALAREHQAGDAVPARVLRHDGRAVLIGGPGGIAHVHLRATTPPLAVGDWVFVDEGAVDDLLDRRSLLQRRDPSTGYEQVIAANIDVVGIVCGLDRPVRSGRIERFVALAWDAGATPLVVFTKRDLVDDCIDAEAVAKASSGGAAVAGVSSITGEGVEDLRQRLSGQTVAFVGESGAGKSALLNALAGYEVAGTGDVREGDHKGRHTTTARQLHTLRGHCRVIDTPGLREVGIWTDTETVDAGFDEIADLARATAVSVTAPTARNRDAPSSGPCKKGRSTPSGSRAGRSSGEKLRQRNCGQTHTPAIRRSDDSARWSARRCGTRTSNGASRGRFGARFGG